MSSVLSVVVLVAVLSIFIGIFLARKSRSAALLFAGIAAPLFLMTGFLLWPVVFPGPGQAIAEQEPSTAQATVAERDPQTAPPKISQATFESRRPIEVESDGYVSADVCAECHKENHASWFASYHRTMTQVATPEAVIGDFDDRYVSFGAHGYHLTQQGEMFWAQLSPNHVAIAPDATELPIVMTTGSHHMQVYWFPSGKSRVLGQLPIVYLKETNQWAPRNACFIQPPGSPPSLEFTRWNSVCSRCHSTHPKQRMEGKLEWDTNVAEFGISCEACHGPAENHIEYHRNLESNRTGPDPIVNPNDLDHRLSSQVCGQCHSINVHLSDETLDEGDTYIPGMSLDVSRHVHQRNQESARHLKSRSDKDPEQFFKSRFWSDGPVRVSGREYNGLIESPCFKQGELSCLSCHAMHQDEDDPRDPCLLYTSPSPRDQRGSRMPSSA